MIAIAALVLAAGAPSGSSTAIPPTTSIAISPPSSAVILSSASAEPGEPSTSNDASSIAPNAPLADERLPASAEIDAALERGIAFLLASQERDGTWGSARNGTYTDLWTNPETHRSWAIGTTGLCCMALCAEGSSAAASAALSRGIDALIAGVSLKRPNEWDLDNVGGYLYGVQALARCLADARFAADPRRDAMHSAAEKYVAALLKLQSPNGGWGYYAMDDAAWNPEWSTSFTTAAILLALCDARAAEIAVDTRVIERAVRALERCRLPSGAYTYTVEAIPNPGRMEGFDQVKGSIGRIQACNLALVRARDALAKDPTSVFGGAARRAGGGATIGRVARTLDARELEHGLDQFFENHRFLDVGRRRPIPHEAYYKIAGYFYFFGHWYAAGVIDELAGSERAPYAAKLAREIVKTQEQDGSMSDYLMHDYVRQYSTAYGVLALGRCRAALR